MVTMVLQLASREVEPEFHYFNCLRYFGADFPHITYFELIMCCI